MKKLAFVVLAMFAIGCEHVKPTSPQVVAYNKQLLSGDGAEIGTLPDGRRIVVYEVWRGDYGNHFIYVVDNAITVTTNRSEQVGKTHVLRTEVVIDGVKFVPEKKDAP